MAALKAAAAAAIGRGPARAGPGALGRSDADEPLPITSSMFGASVAGTVHGLRVLGFDEAADGDEVFRRSGVGQDHRADQQGRFATGARRDRRRARVVSDPKAPACRCSPNPAVRQALSRACAAHARLGPASLVLYDVSTLHFETDAGDGFREPGFSKERRLDPQITLGLLTDAAGFPLTVAAFEGNKAETATMVPVINAFKTAHQLSDVTVVADAGMISEANQVALQAAGCPSSWVPGSPSTRCRARMARQTSRRRGPRRAGTHPVLAGHQQ